MLLNRTAHKKTDPFLERKGTSFQKWRGGGSNFAKASGPGVHIYGRTAATSSDIIAAYPGLLLHLLIHHGSVRDWKHHGDSTGARTHFGFRMRSSAPTKTARPTEQRFPQHNGQQRLLHFGCESRSGLASCQEGDPLSRFLWANTICAHPSTWLVC